MMVPRSVLCVAGRQVRQVRRFRWAVLAMTAGLAGCSYQLGPMTDDSEATATIRPLRPGVVDPAPNDPYRVQPTSRTTSQQAGASS